MQPGRRAVQSQAQSSWDAAARAGWLAACHLTSPLSPPSPFYPSAVIPSFLRITIVSCLNPKTGAICCLAATTARSVYCRLTQPPVDASRGAPGPCMRFHRWHAAPGSHPLALLHMCIACAPGG